MVTIFQLGNIHRQHIHILGLCARDLGGHIIVEPILKGCNDRILQRLLWDIKERAAQRARLIETVHGPIVEEVNARRQLADVDGRCDRVITLASFLASIVAVNPILIALDRCITRRLFWYVEECAAQRACLTEVVNGEIVEEMNT